MQHGVLAGLGMPETYYEGLSTSYAKKRDILCSALADTGLTPHVPRGAYYVLADIRRLGVADAKAAGAMTLLDRDQDRAACRAWSFYTDPVGETLCRFCFAKEEDVLEEAGRRLAGVWSDASRCGETVKPFTRSGCGWVWYRSSVQQQTPCTARVSKRANHAAVGGQRGNGAPGGMPRCGTRPPRPRRGPLRARYAPL